MTFVENHLSQLPKVKQRHFSLQMMQQYDEVLAPLVKAGIATKRKTPAPNIIPTFIIPKKHQPLQKILKILIILLNLCQLMWLKLILNNQLVAAEINSNAGSNASKYYDFQTSYKRIPVLCFIGIDLALSHQ